MVVNDIQQKFNLAEKHPAKMMGLKNKMLLLKDEMVAEGGTWFSAR